MCKSLQLVGCLLLATVIGNSVLNAQNKKDQSNYNLFTEIKSSFSNNNFSLNTNALYKLVKQKPLRVEIEVNLEGKKQIVSLRKQKLWAKGYHLSSENNVPIVRNHLHYRGHLGDDSNSRVYLSIDGFNVSLQIYKGNRYWILRPLNSKINKRVYKLSRHFKDANEFLSFQCNANSHEALGKVKHENYNPSSISDGSVSIYIEADYTMYEKFNNSIVETSNYITSVFEQVAHIYANEQIDIEIAGIKVWDTPDPYDVSSSDAALASFKSQLGSNFSGDLAHLISGNNSDHGGKAFIDALCDKSIAFGYSNFLGTYTSLSNFSFDVFVMAHELGHNFGSHHTHDCVWGPSNDKVLDTCTPSEENCDVLNEGVQVGTIMSYCHIDPIGVNFESGFGPEPGNLIREKYVACLAIDGISCETAIELDYYGKHKARGLVKGYGASQPSADHANWFKFTPETDGHIKIFNCLSGIDSRLWVHTGTCGNLITLANSDDECGPEGQQSYSSGIPHMQVDAGETLYFEWDDRWSNEGFEFWFKFGALEN